jgi:zinc transport system substrate-binding protein
MKHMLIVLALGLLVVVSGCSREAPSEDDAVVVAVSINPLASLVHHVGGDRIEILRLVPPGASPHTFEPAPSQIARMGDADVLFLIGLGLEFWADDLVSAADNPDLVVVRTSRGVEPIEENHHVWLDPTHAISQVELIRDTLKDIDPDGAEEYESKASRFIDELRDLDREIEAEIDQWSQKSFIAFHPAWIYFARRYGLTQAAVVEETPGHEPSVHELTHVIETAKRLDARAIFAEPQLPPAEAETIAEESGAKVLFLDPLGGTKAPDDYIGLIRYNVETMASAMR